MRFKSFGAICNFSVFAFNILTTKNLNFNANSKQYCKIYINIAKCLDVWLFICLSKHHVQTERPRGLQFC